MQKQLKKKQSKQPKNLNNIQYSWDLKFIYKDDNEYLNDLEKCENLLKKQITFKNKLNDKETFLEFLSLIDELTKIEIKIGTYNIRLAKDASNIEWLKMQNKVETLYTKYMPLLSWVEKEIEKLTELKILEWIKDSKDFSHQKFLFQEMFRLKKHILPTAINEILSKVINSRTSAGSIYNSFIINDYENPIIEYQNKKIELTQKKYKDIMENSDLIKDQELRKITALKYNEKYSKYKHTFFEIYKSMIERVRENTNFQKFKNPLERYLSSDNIPISIFNKLLEVGEKYNFLNVEFANLFNKILKAKGIKKTYKSDSALEIYKTKQKFTIENGKKIILDVAKQISDEYYEAGLIALKEGRVDYLEAEKKDKGAFCSATSFLDPLILMNWNNDVDSVLTLAHEVGHSIHSILANKTQPLAYQDYSIFLAEIASFTLETLVLEKLIKISKNENEKMHLLFKKLNHFFGSFFRQIQFSYFEHKTITQVFNQENITLETFAENWIESIEKIYTTKSPFIKINPDEKYLWSRIPHFFGSNYYVFQYSTSIVSSTKFVNEILSNNPSHFVSLLKLGSSKLPNDILLENNIDLTKEETYLPLINSIKETIEQINKNIK